LPAGCAGKSPYFCFYRRVQGFFPGTIALMEVMQCADTVSKAFVTDMEKVFNK